jgi:nucleoid DNA-binding protein
MSKVDLCKVIEVVVSTLNSGNIVNLEGFGFRYSK